MVDGLLGETIGLDPRTQNELGRKITNIESNLAREVFEVRRQAHEELLKELSTEQQQNAKEILGPYFEYAKGSTYILEMMEGEAVARARLVKLGLLP